MHELRRTPLNALHRELGAKLVDFAGWEMPLHYGSQIDEHLRVRRECGVFDVSHMQALGIEGADAAALVARVCCFDLRRLDGAGRAAYGCLLNEGGGIIDDVIAYRLAPERLRLVVNAGTAAGDLQWIRSQARDFRAAVTPRDDLAILAVQGPRAREIVWRAAPQLRVATESLARFHAAETGSWLAARTGYTGEDGFELFTEATDLRAVWDALLQAGVTPCGLGARDTLRLEAGFPLYGHELTDETNPRCTPFSWVVKEHKEFYGKSALLAGGCDQVLVGLLLEEGIPREGYRVLVGGEEVGHITSGTFSPLLKKGIALAYVPSGAESGALQVEIRGKIYPAHLVNPPFVGLK